MRRVSILVRSIGVLTGILIGLNAPASLAQEWLGARSQHYRILGTADDDDLVEVGVRLEAFFTAVNSTLFRGQQLRSPAPTTVIVLDDDDDVEELGLTPEADGYFLAGRNENFMILSPESRSRKPFEPIMRGFFLTIAEDNLPDMPVWIREGLAEFYSTIEMDDELLVIGRHIEEYIRAVRDEDDRLPYAEVFEGAPTGNPADEERDQMLQAQSWALIHFLMMRNRGPGLAETATFAQLLNGGGAFEESFRGAFGTSFEDLQEEFDDYLDERSFPFLRMTISGIGEDYVTMDADPFSPAQGETYLADLMLEAGRTAEAERRLQAAIAREGGLSAPHTSLGGLRLQQGRHDEALESLERAVEGSGPTHLSHHYYALAYHRVNPDLSDEGRALLRQHLGEAIRLGPEFADAHHELAVTYVDAGDDLDEAARLLDRALTLSPDHPAYLVTLSRVLIAQGFPDAARSVLERVLELTDDQAIRGRAESILESIAGQDEGQA